MIRRFSTAVAFLTRFPVASRSTYDPRDVARATLFFPVVGVLIGFVQLLPAWLFAWLGTPIGMQAALSVLALLLFAGGLHQDALADMVDGFGGGRTRDDVLLIMRDSRIGAFGTMALVATLGTRALALTYLHGAGRGWHWVVVAGALARCSAWIGWMLPYARGDDAGLGSAVTDHLGSYEIIGGTALAMLFASGLLGVPLAILAAGVAGAAFVHNGMLCRRRIGGVTGDTLGAATETAEILVLLLGTVVVDA